MRGRDMDVLTAIQERRSIRKYKADPVPGEILREILDAVRWAPSWANTQCWEVIIVSNPETRHKLSATLPAGNPARDSFLQAPLVIVACARTGKAGYYKGKPVTDKGDWYMFDVALAMHNLTLAAHARGLGTVHVGLFDARAVADILEVPPDIAVVELIPLGYPDGQPSPPSRKDTADFVWHDKYRGA